LNAFFAINAADNAAAAACSITPTTPPIIDSRRAAAGNIALAQGSNPRYS